MSASKAAAIPTMPMRLGPFAAGSSGTGGGIGPGDARCEGELTGELPADDTDDGTATGRGRAGCLTTSGGGGASVGKNTSFCDVRDGNLPNERPKVDDLDAFTSGGGRDG